MKKQSFRKCLFEKNRYKFIVILDFNESEYAPWRKWTENSRHSNIDSNERNSIEVNSCFHNTKWPTTQSNCVQLKSIWINSLQFNFNIIIMNRQLSYAITSVKKPVQMQTILIKPIEKWMRLIPEDNSYIEYQIIAAFYLLAVSMDSKMIKMINSTEYVSMSIFIWWPWSISESTIWIYVESIVHTHAHMASNGKNAATVCFRHTRDWITYIYLFMALVFIMCIFQAVILHLVSFFFSSQVFITIWWSAHMPFAYFLSKRNNFFGTVIFVRSSYFVNSPIENRIDDNWKKILNIDREKKRKMTRCVYFIFSPYHPEMKRKSFI